MASLHNSTQHADGWLVHEFERVGVHHLLIDGESGGTHLLLADGVGGDGIVDLLRATVPTQFLEVGEFEPTQQDD